MRVAFAGLICLLAAFAFSPARADPYPWCAMLNVGDNAYNCYFLTREQCETYLSGIGGFCLPNRFYDGKPVGD